MNPIWLEHYPPGVPAEVDISRFASLKDCLLYTSDAADE